MIVYGHSSSPTFPSSRAERAIPAESPFPIVPYDALSVFYDAQMEAEAAAAQLVRDLAVFYRDIVIEVIEGVAYAYIGSIALKLVFKAGTWVVQGVVRIAGKVYEGMEFVVGIGIILVYKGGEWVLKHPKAAGEAVLGYLGLREVFGNNFGGEPAPVLPGIPYDIYPHPFGWDCSGGNDNPDLY